jgi:hypothetical protein
LPLLISKGIPRTGIAILEFYPREIGRAQPYFSCSRNTLFAVSSAVLLVRSGHSSLLSRMWA